MCDMRRAGIRQFETAWEYSWRKMPWERWRRRGKEGWEAALLDTRDAWQDAWEGKGVEMARAFELLAAAPQLTPDEWRELPPERTEDELVDLLA
jgi:hypothetical protein